MDQFHLILSHYFLLLEFQFQCFIHFLLKSNIPQIIKVLEN